MKPSGHEKPRQRWCRTVRLLGGIATGMLMLAQTASAATVPHELRVCGDENESQPFTYLDHHGKNKAPVVAGYNADYLHAMLRRAGHSASITLLPWKRCLILAADGQFDLVIDAVRSPTRERDFVFPLPHHGVSPALIYHSSRPVPTVNSPKDIAALARCTLVGWDESAFGLPPGNEVSGQPISLVSAAAMLRAGRCDVLTFDLELGKAQQGKGGAFPSSEFVVMPVPNLSRLSYHLAISRAVPYRDELLDLINRGVQQMQNSGETARLERLHLSAGLERR